MKTPFTEVLLRPDNLPILLLLPGFCAIFFWWWWRARRNDRLLVEGGEEAVARDMDGPRPEPSGSLGPGPEVEQRVHTWPYLLRIELLVALLVMIILTVWSILIDAPLEQLADPNRTPNPSKAPWYFLGLQEMLVYFDPWIAGVVLPLLIIVGLCAVPYLDTNRAGSGFYCWRPRRFALVTFWFGFGLWIILILVGTFLRGPGWNWFWPWQPWDPTLLVDATSIDWPQLFGIEGELGGFLFGGATVAAYYGSAFLLWGCFRRQPAWQELGATRFAIVAFLLLTMLSLPLKIALRLALNVKYVWVTPWFNV